ncbi:tyrosine-type recombinase/integrase [Cupriavidus sp. D39]|uniref:tyrosine-type recombinase/integrase n=1 Tax=Cupriavidus sp. D39 TaxID=2997877 RepID=UPI003B63E926
MAEGLELGHQWEVPAAQRLRFVLNFAYATGLRISELVSATQGQIEVDGHGDHWLHLVGKGSKATKVALPPLARAALDRYLMQRELPITPARWDPRTPLIGRHRTRQQPGKHHHDQAVEYLAAANWLLQERWKKG